MSKQVRVIIAGSRDFTNYNLLAGTMDGLMTNYSTPEFEIVVVCGDARGADMLGANWAIERSHSIEHYPANWDKYGKRAGYLRNEDMAKHADLCVCFWDGKSKGTQHMINLAQQYNLPTRIINY